MGVRHKTLAVARRAVPSRVDHDDRRQAAARELPRAGGSVNIAGAIAKLIARVDLARDEMAAVFGEIMDGAATPAQIGGLLVALRAKGETVDELVGAATAMRARATPLAFDASRAIDTCGTGGDGVGTINVSTLAAILIAACGGTVAKHGNRAQSSKCGSADVLEALGVAIDREPAVVERQLAYARHRLHVRAAVSRGDASCGRPAQGARHADDLQPARTAHEPSACRPSSRRRLRPRMVRADGDSARSARRAPGGGRARRRESR